MSSKPEQTPADEQQPAKKPNLLQVTQSVLAALFGVQSAKNRERDFRQGKATDYIAIYVVLVIALVVAVIVAVNMVLSGTGA